MAVTKKEPDGEHPASHYLHAPGDTVSEWKLRYKDADGKVDPRLLGACHAALTVGYRGNKVDLPEDEKRKCLARLKALYRSNGLEWPDAQMSAVHLSSEPLGESAETDEDTPADDGMVVRTGLLCRAGDYPAHEWSITPEQMQAAAAAYDGSGYVELEHLTSQGKSTILDGQLGELRAVWCSEDGSELYGDVALPAWLDAAAEKAGRKVSAVWHRATQTLKGIGLVLDPAVPDAALLSAHVAFTKRHDTPQGQQAMQHLHDVTTQYGAVCQASNAGLASKHEAGAIQAMHDMATSHGATCSAMGGTGTASGGGGGGLALYGSDTTGTVITTGSTVTLGTAPTAEVDVQPKEKTPVGDTNPTKQDTATGSGPSIAALQAQLDAEKKQREEDRKALVSLQAERRVEKANAFVDKLITENKVLPAERDLLVRLHVMVATDDDSGLVTLADGGTESRLAVLVAALSARQVIGLTKEQIAANPKVTVLLNRQQTQEAEEAEKGTPEELDNLLAMTDTGRKVLAARRAGGR